MKYFLTPKVIKRGIQAVVISLLSPAALAQTIYVSPSGNDNNNGSIGSPLKTLEGARAKVERMDKSRGIQVLFRGGRYPITQTVTFRDKDSGTPSKKVIYKSHPGETAFFDGMRRLDNNKFSLVTGSLANRLPSRARGKVYSQVITDANLIRILKGNDAGMSHNSSLLRLTSTPNKGFLHVKDIQSQGAGIGSFSNPKGAAFNIHESINFSQIAEELSRGGKQGYLSGYLSSDWRFERIALQRLGGTGSKVFVLKDKSANGLEGATNQGRFRIKNLLATLDSEREWFFDELDRRLYYWPPGGRINNSDRIGVWAGPDCIVVTNGKNIAFEGIVFQHFGGGTEDVINVQDGKGIRIAGCTFRYVALPMAPVSFRPGASDCIMQSCDLYDNGRGSRLGGGSFGPNAVTKGRNSIENCHFTQVQTNNYYGNAASIFGAGQTFRNNLCHNANGQPIVYDGIDHYIAYNEVFNVGVEEGDGGAIYTGGDLYSFNNRVERNFVHHIISIPGILKRAGLFSDDYDAGEIYKENVIYKVGGAGIKMNAGSGHTISNNVLLDSEKGVALLGRPETYTEKFNKAAGLLKSNPSSTSKENYIGRAEKVIGDFANNSNATYNTRWDNSFWARRYPILRNMLRKSSSRLGMFPSEIRVYDNLFSGNQVNFEHANGFGAERNSRNVSKSLFANPSLLNFQFKNVPSGFPRIPFNQIGLRKDAYRKNVPSKNDYRGKVFQRWRNTNASLSGSYNRSTVNQRIYYNTGQVIITASQSGLGVREGNANNGGSNNGGGSINSGSFVARSEYLYDLGTPTSPVLPGYTRLSERNRAGFFRWNSDARGIVSVDRGSSGGLNNITRDFCRGSETRTFLQRIPNGAWDVTMTIGDSQGIVDNIRVVAEGRTVLNNIDRARGVIKDEFFQTTVRDGQLDLQINDDGGANSNWAVNRIIYRKSPNKFLFDMGTPTSPLQSGYTRVSQLTRSGAFRWNSNAAGVSSVDRGSRGGNRLNRDLCFSRSPRLFLVKVQNGRWKVTVTLGDSASRHDDMRIQAEGITVKNNIDRNAGVLKNEIFEVNVSDGQLDLRFSDEGGSDPNWVINRIILEKVN